MAGVSKQGVGGVSLEKELLEEFFSELVLSDNPTLSSCVKCAVLPTRN